MQQLRGTDLKIEQSPIVRLTLKCECRKCRRWRNSGSTLRV